MNLLHKIKSDRSILTNWFIFKLYPTLKKTKTDVRSFRVLLTLQLLLGIKYAHKFEWFPWMHATQTQIWIRRGKNWREIFLTWFSFTLIQHLVVSPVSCKASELENNKFEPNWLYDFRHNLFWHYVGSISYFIIHTAYEWEKSSSATNYSGYSTYSLIEIIINLKPNSN